MSNEWIPLVTRKESPLWVSLVCLGGSGKYFDETLSWDYEIRNYKYENNTHSIAVSDAIQLKNCIDERTKTGDFFAYYLERCVRYSNALLETAKTINQEFNVDELVFQTKLDFADVWGRFGQAVQQAMPFLASLVLVQDTLESSLRTVIAEVLEADPTSVRVTESLNSLVVAPKDTNVILESRSLLQLASKVEAVGYDAKDFDGEVESVLKKLDARCPGFSAALDAHIRSFGWIKTFTYLGEPFSKTEILLRIQGHLNRGDVRSRLLSNEERATDTLTQARRQIEHLFGETESASLMRLAGEYLYWRFERIDVHFQSEVLIRPLERAIAAEAGFAREELVHCTYPELMNWLRDGSELPSRDELAERIANGVDCFVDDGVFTVRTRTSARANSGSKEDAEIVWPLRGTSACLGSATGVARLIFSADDIHKLNQGEILVTTMTTPDLMLAIEKCAAIVTDEGGLLCHAAIISRELQIPCVIGTGGATTALRDGDYITVNATTVEGTVSPGDHG